MNKLRWTVAFAAVAGLFLLPKAWADLSVKDGAGATQTVFGFVCFTTKLCNATTLTNSAGTEVGTSGAPLQVTVANTGANATAVKVNVASGGIASGGIASGAVASGAIASGAFASGAVASGAFVANAIVDLTTIIGHVDGLETLIGSTNTKLDTLNTNVTAAIPPGAAIIGKVGIDQTTPGTTNLVAITPAQAGVGATGAAAPANANYMGALSGSTTGGLTTGLIACDSTVIYDASTSGSTELVALSSGKSIYVCGYSIIAGGTVNVKLISGTGTACATGSSNKTPAYQLTAQAGISDGAPFFRGLKTAVSNALCINASAGVAAQAIVYYAQF